MVNKGWGSLWSPAPFLLEFMPPEPTSATPKPDHQIPAPASSSGLLCLKPAPWPGKPLPQIDPGDVLLADQTLAAPCEIVSGLLHAGTKAVLASCSKAGKTWLLLDLAISITTGTPFLKWATTAGRVLFINFEIHRAFIQQRLRTLTTGKGLADLSHLSVWTLRGQAADFDTLLDEITARIQNERYSLIILDPLYKLMIGRSENTADGVNSLCQSIERLVAETGAAVMYAHHYTKGNASKKKAMDRMSGSGVFARDADTIITLTEHQEEGCYAVETALRNLPPQPSFVVQWTYPVMVERPDLDPADLKGVSGDHAQNDDLEFVLGLLDDGPLTTADWQKAAEVEGYSRATFFRKKQGLETGNRVAFDPETKTWTRTTSGSLTSLTV